MGFKRPPEMDGVLIEKGSLTATFEVEPANEDVFVLIVMPNIA